MLFAKLLDKINLWLLVKRQAKDFFRIKNFVQSEDNKPPTFGYGCENYSAINEFNAFICEIVLCLHLIPEELIDEYKGAMLRKTRDLYPLIYEADLRNGILDQIDSARTEFDRLRIVPIETDSVHGSESPSHTETIEEHLQIAAGLIHSNCDWFYRYVSYAAGEDSRIDLFTKTGYWSDNVAKKVLELQSNI